MLRVVVMSLGILGLTDGDAKVFVELFKPNSELGGRF